MALAPCICLCLGFPLSSLLLFSQEMPEPLGSLAYDQRTPAGGSGHSTLELGRGPPLSTHKHGSIMTQVCLSSRTKATCKVRGTYPGPLCLPVSLWLLPMWAQTGSPALQIIQQPSKDHSPQSFPRPQTWYCAALAQVVWGPACSPTLPLTTSAQSLNLIFTKPLS